MKDPLKMSDQNETLGSTIFVVSLQNVPGVDRRNYGRLDKFKQKWVDDCGPASLQDIQICPGVYDQRRGYGLMTSFLFCLERAREMDLNVSIIMEDDARLFKRATAFCKPRFRNELGASLPPDTFLAFLGGHTWVYPQGKESGFHDNVFRETSLSFGTYGFAVPRSSLDFIISLIKEDIIEGFTDQNGIHHRDFLSPERSWYRAAKSMHRKIYAFDPLIVWHEGGYSNTWGRDRGDITGEEEDNRDGKEKGPRGIKLSKG